ncbi:L-serine ammonia-lyase [Desulfovibrio sp. OttesenSCG-928-G15]|nr:L-serine ammonia-lyase [Desulfovibrio sp. OttesenSCG-928-G15]
MDSIQSIFKIGIGPSSSHTLGPMRAAAMFLQLVSEKMGIDRVASIKIDLYGSLSLTGKGHLTDQGILLGLSGYLPTTVPVESIASIIDEIRLQHTLRLGSPSHQAIPFDYEKDLTFHEEFLPLHENGMTLSARAQDGTELSESYYSIGGGEIATKDTLGRKEKGFTVPYPFASAEELLALCEDNSLTIAGLTLANECAVSSKEAIHAHCTQVWTTMMESMNLGMVANGVLPGPLKVPRRANRLRNRLVAQKKLSNDPFIIMDHVNLYALAVSEQNAAGGRVVTAPTNGSCGVVPAVMHYYDAFIAPLDGDMLMRFLLTAGSIGLLFRMNASLSGAEVGCQGEVGVACSMAAAGLAELMGASPAQVCIAAEIGMEHNLGLTCDPVNGQVQIPCIERNAVNAVKAINAARMAMERATMPRVSLDNVIEAMMNTGKDMNAKYRETAQGGLAALGLKWSCR